MIHSLILLLLVAPNAFASRASVLTYGTGDAGAIVAAHGQGGTLYREDPYNLFYNPSYVNDFRNWAILEKSNRADALDVGSTAMGGGVGSWMNFRYGIFVNRVGAISGTYSHAARNSMRPVDLLIGGDHGALRWGIGATYGSVKLSETASTSQDLVGRVGAQIFNFEPFVNAKLIGRDTGIENEDLIIGTRYRWDEWVPYAAYRVSKSGGVETATNFGAGLGRSYQMSERVGLSGSLSVWRLIGAAERATALPLDLATDVLLTGWLTVRGGFTFRLISRTENVSGADTTTARIGARIKMTPAEIDWIVGTVSGIGPFDESVTSNDAQSLGIAPGFFSVASFTIRW